MANTLANVSLAAGKVFSFILSNAEASASFSVNFSLCDSTLNGKAFNCSVAPNDKEVLSYDAASGKWKPRAISGLNYQGTFSAASGSAPTSSDIGDYFIVNVAGVISGVSYSVGDWIVLSSVGDWERINNSNAITSVMGRTGAITAVKGDYSLNKMADVDLSTTTPNNGDVLKFNGTNWVPGVVSVGGGGTVTGVTGTAPIISSGGSAPVVSITQATSSVNGYLTSADWNTFNNKEGAISAGSSTEYYRGDKMFATLDTSAVAENGNLYFQNARVLGVPLAGIDTAQTSAITSADSVLSALGKAQGQLDNLTSGGANFLIKNGTDSVTGQVTINATTGSLKIPTTPSGVDLTDAANVQYVKDYADTKLAKTGGALSGDLQINTNLKLKDSGSNTVSLQAPATIPSSYVLKLPTALGSANQVLTTDASGNLSWSTPATASISLAGDIGGTAGANTIGAGKVTLTNLSATGTKNATTYLRGDNTWGDIQTLVLGSYALGTNAVLSTTDTIVGAFGKLQKQITDLAASAVGGDLSGTLPNPSIAKLQGTTVTTSSLATKNVLKYNGSAWVNSMLSATDLSATGTTDSTTYLAGDNTWKNFFSNVIAAPLTGLSSSGITYANKNVAATDTVLQAANKLLFTQNDYISKSADNTIFGTLAINSTTGFITVPTPVNPNDAANKSYVDGFGQWTKTGSDIYRSSGNVGIGTMAPSGILDVQAALPIFKLGATTATNPSYISFSNAGSAFAGVESSTGGYMFTGSLPYATVFGSNSNYATQFGQNGQVRMTINTSGNVGIGTTSPTAVLDVNGTIRSRDITNAGSTIDFATGNYQYTSAACGAITLNNLKSGSSYMLAVQGAAGGTCAFTAYSGVATGALTVKVGSMSLVQTAAKHAMFTFVVMGSYVYVAAVDGF